MNSLPETIYLMSGSPPVDSTATIFGSIVANFFTPYGLMFNPLYVFLWSIVLPSFLIPWLIRKKFFPKEKKLPSLFNLAIPMILFGFGALFIWSAFVDNIVYYEWDSILIPYSFLWHEAPSALNETWGWIAHGWSQVDLTALWLVMTFTVYILAGCVALFVQRKHSSLKIYRKYVQYSVIAMGFLSIVGVAFPYLLYILELIFSVHPNLFQFLY